MPANLNALMRYQQIDKTLRNRYVKATMDRLIDECSKQLTEYRGRKTQISERTIRDDIRIMRSGALGFNAPIIVHEGVYSYDDEDYSIFNEYVKEKTLMAEILKMLIYEKDNIKDPRLSNILSKLSELTGIEIEFLQIKEKRDYNSNEFIKSEKTKKHFDLEKTKQKIRKIKDDLDISKMSSDYEFFHNDIVEIRWGEVFDLL